MELVGKVFGRHKNIMCVSGKPGAITCARAFSRGTNAHDGET